MTNKRAATVFKGADWVLSEVRDVGAPVGIYGAECMTCEGRSPLVDDDRGPVIAWAIEHAKEYPEHTMFLARTETHWRVHPPGPLPGAAAFFDRAFGPVFVLLMCALTAFSGFFPLLL